MVQKKNCETAIKGSGGKRGPKEDLTWRAPFLEVLNACANVRAACVAAKVGRATAYRAREDDPEFALLWDEARENAIDALEAVARTRAMGSSDSLLMFLLKGERPDKYRERSSVEVGGKDGEPIPVAIQFIPYGRTDTDNS